MCVCVHVCVAGALGRIFSDFMLLISACPKCRANCIVPRAYKGMAQPATRRILHLLR